MNRLGRSVVKEIREAGGIVVLPEEREAAVERLAGANDVCGDLCGPDVDRVAGCRCRDEARDALRALQGQATP